MLQLCPQPYPPPQSWFLPFTCTYGNESRGRLDYEGLTPKGTNKDSGSFKFNPNPELIWATGLHHKGTRPLCGGAGKWRGGGGAGKPQPGREGGTVGKGRRFVGEVLVRGNAVGRAKEGPIEEVTGSPGASKGAAPGFSTYSCPRNRLQAGLTPSPQFSLGIGALSALGARPQAGLSTSRGGMGRMGCVPATRWGHFLGLLPFYQSLAS